MKMESYYDLPNIPPSQDLECECQSSLRHWNPTGCLSSVINITKFKKLYINTRLVIEVFFVVTSSSSSSSAGCLSTRGQHSEISPNRTWARSQRAGGSDGGSDETAEWISSQHEFDGHKRNLTQVLAAGLHCVVGASCRNIAVMMTSSYCACADSTCCAQLMPCEASASAGPSAASWPHSAGQPLPQPRAPAADLGAGEGVASGHHHDGPLAVFCAVETGGTQQEPFYRSLVVAAHINAQQTQRSVVP